LPESEYNLVISILTKSNIEEGNAVRIRIKELLKLFKSSDRFSLSLIKKLSEVNDEQEEH
jgi:hypothetical protein